MVCKEKHTWSKVAINRRGKYPQGEIAPYLRDSSGFLQESFHLILSEDHIHGRPAGKRDGRKQVSFFTTLEVEHPRLDCFSESVQETRVSKKIPFSKLRLDSNLINRISDQSKKSLKCDKMGVRLMILPKENHGSSRDGTSPTFVLSDLLVFTLLVPGNAWTLTDSSQDLVSLTLFLQSSLPSLNRSDYHPNQYTQESIF